VCIIIRTSSELSTPVVLTAAECLAGLAASDRWDAPEIRAVALKALATSRASARIQAAQRYGMTEWLKPALVEICATPWGNLTVEDLTILEPSSVLKIMKIRSGYSVAYSDSKRNQMIDYEFDL
jgi:hypothetical protein